MVLVADHRKCKSNYFFACTKNHSCQSWHGAFFAPCEEFILIFQGEKQAGKNKKQLLRKMLLLGKVQRHFFKKYMIS